MSKNFQYAPGLPGYGTRGIDGSIGLNGLATYFSSYDGTLDSITLRTKIVANKILFSTDELLPGYPTRIYQTGDMFVDKNGRIFEIDLTLTEKYINTGQQLNTSGLFEAGPNTTVSPIFSRYSNAFTTSKYLIDVVYTDIAPGNYAANPSSIQTIYGIPAVNYAQINYVNHDLGTFSYHPYNIFINSTDTTHPERAIALVKENGVDTWHFGNRNSINNIRNVNYNLDFAKVTIDGSLQVNNNSYFNHDISINGSINVDGSSYLNNILEINTSTYVSIEGGASFNIYDGGDIILDSGNIEVESGDVEVCLGTISIGSGLNNYEEDNNLNLYTKTRTDNSTSDISIGTGTLATTDVSSITTGNISIKTGKLIYHTNDIGNNSGSINIYTSNGQDSEYYSGGRSGDINILIGDGGNGGDTGNGGNSGSLNLTSGNGGNGEDSGDGGNGGSLNLTSGNGGIGSPGDGGNGGDLLIRSGNGASGDWGGDAGNINLYAGNGGIGDSGGDAGYVNIYGGNAGNGFAEIGKSGGNVKIYGGNGGTGSPADGNGGNVYIYGGEGGGSGEQGTVYLGHNGSSVVGEVHVKTRLKVDLVSTGAGDYYTVWDSISKRLNVGPAWTSSDIRLKRNIKEIKNSLNILKKINVYTYNYNKLAVDNNIVKEEDLNILQFGAIAQETEEIFPIAVKNLKSFKNDGTPDFDYKALDYERFIPLLIGGIKEQQNQILELKKIVEKQQKQINKLLK